MNILFINKSRGRGGGEEFLRDLLPGLAARGVRVGLMCRPASPLMRMFQKSDITLHPIESSGWHVMSAVLKTARVIRQGGYTVVNIQRSHDIAQSWLGSVLSRKRPLLLYTVQVAEFLRSRFLLGRMKKIVTISRYIRDKITSFMPELASRVVIVYYGIDLSVFSVVRRGDGLFRCRFGLSSHTPVIGTVGDLWKNQIEFIDALVIVRKIIPEVRYALVASDTDAEYVEKFKRRAADLGIADALIWTGRLSKEQMHAFYAGMDIVVSTHRNEGFGIWVLEALAMGVPVVAFAEGGILDSLEGCPAGILIRNGIQEMADEVVRLLKDKEVRNAMSEDGPRWVMERFSLERMINEYYDLFRLLVSSQSSSGNDS
jgi:glycosyltransferase involved in cell wall biosynthesis